MVSWHTHTCICIYTHTKFTAVPAPIFTKLMNEQQHYVQIKYTKFHTNHTRNVEGTDRNSIRPFSHEWLSLRQQSQNAQSVNTCLFWTYPVWSCIQISWKSKNMGKISFTPLYRLYQFSLQNFSWNSQLINGSTWRYTNILNFSKIQREIRTAEFI
jgi:hypothetical protein